ncbi:hypothetical protein SC663_07705, partial [Legionella pneumophila serogroup 1]
KPLLGRSLRKTVVKISNFKATGLLRRYAPRNDGPKNRTVQRGNIKAGWQLPTCFTLGQIAFLQKKSPYLF